MQRKVVVVDSAADMLATSTKVDRADTRSGLRALHVVLSMLGALMTLWILVAPASWRPPEYRKRMGMSPPPPHFLIQEDIQEIFHDHPAVIYTHLLPGALWGALITPQFWPGFAWRFPTLHRWSGRALMAASLAISIGYFVIEARGLMYREHLLAWRMMIGWFVFTGLAAIYFARQRQYARHAAWVTHHIAVGTSVAVARILTLPLLSELWRAAGGVVDVHIKGQGFLVGVAISAVGLGMLVEWVLRRSSKQQLLNRGRAPAKTAAAAAVLVGKEQ